MRYLLAAWCLCVILVGPAASAQPLLPSLPPIQTAGNSLKTGSWVEYTILLRSTGRRLTLRLAALKKKGEARWYEMSVKFAKGHSLILKTLIQEKAGLPAKSQATVLQISGQPAFYLPAEVGAARLRLDRASEGAGPRQRSISSGKVKVPAGVFRAERFRKTNKGRVTQIWTSAEVAGWPMIKLVSPSIKLELLAHGKDATSQIKGKPIKIDGGLVTGF